MGCAARGSASILPQQRLRANPGTGAIWEGPDGRGSYPLARPPVPRSGLVQLLQSGVDRSVIALWPGHESVETTYIYLHADLKLKEAALAKTTPTQGTPDRYHPDDEVLAFLNGLQLFRVPCPVQHEPLPP